MRDGERSVVVTLLLRWSTPIVSVGDTVSLEYAFEPATWSPTKGALTLRDASGALLLWIEQAAAGPSALTPPDGIRVANGKKVCSWAESCGVRSHASTRVQVGEQAADIAYGGTADVGEYAFAIGENSPFDFKVAAPTSAARTPC